jgi:hypothetical protein
MASINVNVSTIVEMSQELDALRSRLEALLSGTSAAVVAKSGKKQKMPRKESSRKGHGTAWSDFTKKLLSEHAEEVKAHKEANPDLKGAHLTFCANYKKEHTEEWKEFEAAWKEAHPKLEKAAASDSASEAGSASEGGSDSEAAGAPADAKPKRVLSEEQKRKMQEGRQKKKAEKEAAAAAEESAAKSEGASEAAPAPAPAPAAGGGTKKAPKKAEKAAPEPTPAPTPAPPAEAEADDEDDGPEFQSFVLGKTKYFRLGSRRPDGSIIWASGDLWENNKGAKGDYVGELQEDGSIDTSAQEPELE